MIAALALYGTLIGAIFVVAAHYLEAASSHLGIPRRSVWLGAILGTLFALAAASFSRGGTVNADANTRPTPISVANGLSVLRPAGPEAMGPFRIERRLLAIGTNGNRFGRFDRSLSILWMALSGSVMLFTLGAFLLILVRRKQWHPAVIHGVTIFLAPDAGPAAFGLLHPSVVIPKWTLSMTHNERALILAHELTHIERMDPAVLGIAQLALIAMPWNMPLWYAFTRLRLAAELDCDQVVLRHFPDVRAYGSLLLDVCAHGIYKVALDVAFSRSTWQLQRRILTMTDVKETQYWSVISRSIVAAGALAVACAVPRPTASNARSDALSSVGLSAQSRLQEDALLHAERSDGSAAARRNALSESLRELTGRNSQNEVSRLLDTTSIDGEIRTAIAKYYPTALSGELGERPYIWFVVDDHGTVLRHAIGRNNLTHRPPGFVRDSLPSFYANMDSAKREEIDAHGIEILDADAVRREFPGLELADPSNAMQLRWVQLRGTSIDVAWIRIMGGKR